MTNHQQAAIEAAARAIARSRCDPLLHSEIQRGLYADKRWHEYETDAQAAITAYLAAVREAGFVMVPVEPTEAMLKAAIYHHVPSGGSGNTFLEVYRAMIAARPQNRGE